MLVSDFGNNCAYAVIAIVCANIVERRRMIVPKEKSGSKKKCDTNFVGIIHIDTNKVGYYKNSVKTILYQIV